MTKSTLALAREAGHHQCSSPSILFIDDNHANNFLIKSYIRLDKIPVIPHFECNAIDALDYLNQLPVSDFPDFIFVDINMPLMDGFEFISEFVERFPAQCERTTIYILSSSIRPSDKEQSMQFDVVKDYIEKPLKPDFLQNIAASSLMTSK